MASHKALSQLILSHTAYGTVCTAVQVLLSPPHWNHPLELLERHKHCSSQGPSLSIDVLTEQSYIVHAERLFVIVNKDTKIS